MWDRILKILNENKDALSWLFGSGVILAVLGGIYRLIVWLFKEYRLRKIRTSKSFPFKVIPPNSNVAKAILSGPDDDPFADHNIPYQQRIQGRNTRRELEELIEDKRWILIAGRAGLGKTREATQLAQSLNNEGWTVLYLTREAWLDAPAILPTNVPERKLLFFLDDLNKKCLSSRAEIHPNASESLTLPVNESFQTRLQRTLDAFDAFCGKSEIRVIATARNEKTTEFDEPSEWEKLGWAKYKTLWDEFELIELPEPDDNSEERLLIETAEKTGVVIRSEDISLIAKRNDGTYRNLVENLASSQTEGYILSTKNFRDTLKGTWQKRYQKAINKYPAAKHIYDSIDLIQSIGLELRFSTVVDIAKIVSKEDVSISRKYEKYSFILKQLISTENLLRPRDGQIDGKGYRIDKQKYLPALYKQIYFNWMLRDSKFYFLQRLALQFEEGVQLYFLPNSLLMPSASLVSFKKHIFFLFSFTNLCNGIARAYSHLGHYEMAESIYLKVLQISSANYLARALTRKTRATTWNNLGYDYLETKNDEKALEAFKEAIKLHPKKAFSWNGLGSANHRLNRQGDAILGYQRAIQFDRKYVIPWLNLGSLYSNIGQYEDALHALQKAIKLDSKDPLLWDDLGYIYGRLGQHDNAIEAYQNAIRLRPGWTSPWISLGSAYLVLKRDQDARNAFQKAIDTKPTDAYSWYRIGNMYRRYNDYDKALQAYQQAITLDANFDYPRFGIGKLYCKIKEYDQALEAFQTATQLGPNDLTNHSALIGVLRRLGRNAEALEQERIARSITNKTNEYEQACLEAVCENREEALRLLRIALEKKQTNPQAILNEPDFDSISDDLFFKTLVGTD